MRGIRGGQSDFQYLARTCGHASLQSRREREPEGSTHPLRVNPNTGDRNFASQALRFATARYGRPTQSRTADTHISRNFGLDVMERYGRTWDGHIDDLTPRSVFIEARLNTTSNPC
jgi:hypothetical protein